MEQKLEQINLEIKRAKINIIKLSLMFIVGVAFFNGILAYKNQLYINEYESSTWYVSDAVYTGESSYWDSDGEGGNGQTKYDVYYSYVGKDGENYKYVEKGELSGGYEGEIVQIYVDEADNSHSLEIKNETERKVFDVRFFLLVVVVVVGPFVFSFFIVYMVLLAKRARIQKELRGK